MIFDYAYAWCDFCEEINGEAEFVIQEYEELHKEECPNCGITLDVVAITMERFSFLKTQGVWEI